MNTNLINPEVRFEDYTSFSAFLTDICNTDKWENITLGSIKMGYSKGKGETYVDTSADVNDQLNAAGSLYFSLVGNETYRMPVNACALFTLKDRVGISCAYGTALIEDGEYEKYSQLFNLALPYDREKIIKLLRRKGQILAGHSSNYVVIRQDEIFRELDTILHSRFSGCELTRAVYSNEQTLAVYDLADSSATIMDAYTDACIRSGISPMQIEDSRASLLVSTSDIGESTVQVEPLLSLGGIEYPLGEKFKVKHHGKGSIDTVRRCIDMSYASIGDGLSTIAEMIETPVNYPVSTLIAAAKEVGIHKNAKKALKTVVADYSASIGSTKQNAFDIYQALLDIKYTDQFEKLTRTTKLKIEESFCRLLKIKWEKIDIPGPTEV